MEEIVNDLILNNKTISTMESCTGGFVASSITNISGSSKIFKFGAVTYSNEYKIRMGVNKDVINEYSVYSIETAKEMSKKISDFTNSDYGVGVTGTINEIDPNNISKSISKVYLSVYIKSSDEYLTKCINTIKASRIDNKEYITKNIVEMIRSVL